MISKQVSHISYLGLSLLLLDVVASLFSAGGFLSASLASLGLLSYRNLFFYAMMVTTVCLGFFLFARRQWGLSPIGRRTLIAGFACVIIGDVALLLALTILPSPVMFGITGSLSAACIVVTGILWGIAYGNLDFKQVLFYTSCSFGIAAVLSLVIMIATSGWFLFAVMMLTPVLSLLCLIPLMKSTEEAEEQRRDQKTGRFRSEPDGLITLTRIFISETWPILVGATICLIFLGLMWNGPMELSGFTSHTARGSLLGVILGSLILMLVARFYRDGDRLLKRCCSVVPAVAVLPLISSILEVNASGLIGMLFGALTGLSCVYFFIFVFCVLVESRSHWGVSRTKSWSAFFICGAIFLLLGFSLSNRTKPSIFEVVALVVFSIYVILVTIYAIFFVGSKNPRREPADVNLETQLERECQQLTERYGLSNLESEVLSLLVHGRNAGYIAKSLSITPEVAESDIDEVYDKLDVHSHKELIDLFD